MLTTEILAPNYAISYYPVLSVHTYKLCVWLKSWCYVVSYDCFLLNPVSIRYSHCIHLLKACYAISYILYKNASQETTVHVFQTWILVHHCRIVQSPVLQHGRKIQARNSSSPTLVHCTPRGKMFIIWCLQITRRLEVCTNSSSVYKIFPCHDTYMNDTRKWPLNT